MLLKERFNKILFHENNNKKVSEKRKIQLNWAVNELNEFVFATITQSPTLDSNFSLFLQCFSALARK